MPIFLAGLGASPGSPIQNPAALLGLLFPDGRKGNLWGGRFFGVPLDVASSLFP